MDSNATAVTASPSCEEILATLQDLLKGALMLESTAVLRPEARFQEDLCADSLAMVDIVIAVEEGFGIKLQSDLNFFTEVRTVSDAVALIHARLNDGVKA